MKEDKKHKSEIEELKSEIEFLKKSIMASYDDISVIKTSITGSYENIHYIKSLVRYLTVTVLSLVILLFMYCINQ